MTDVLRPLLRGPNANQAFDNRCASLVTNADVIESPLPEAGERERLGQLLNAVIVPSVRDSAANDGAHSVLRQTKSRVTPWRSRYVAHFRPGPVLLIAPSPHEIEQALNFATSVDILWCPDANDSFRVAMNAGTASAAAQALYDNAAAGRAHNNIFYNDIKGFATVCRRAYQHVFTSNVEENVWNVDTARLAWRIHQNNIAAGIPYPLVWHRLIMLHSAVFLYCVGKDERPFTHDFVTAQRSPGFFGRGLSMYGSDSGGIDKVYRVDDMEMYCEKFAGHISDGAGHVFKVVEQDRCGHLCYQQLTHADLHECTHVIPRSEYVLIKTGGSHALLAGGETSYPFHVAAFDDLASRISLASSTLSHAEVVATYLQISKRIQTLTGRTDAQDMAALGYLAQDYLRDALKGYRKKAVETTRDYLAEAFGVPGPLVNYGGDGKVRYLPAQVWQAQDEYDAPSASLVGSSQRLLQAAVQDISVARTSLAGGGAPMGAARLTRLFTVLIIAIFVFTGLAEVESASIWDRVSGFFHDECDLECIMDFDRTRVTGESVQPNFGECEWQQELLGRCGMPLEYPNTRAGFRAFAQDVHPDKRAQRGLEPEDCGVDFDRIKECVLGLEAVPWLRVCTDRAPNVNLQDLGDLARYVTANLTTHLGDPERMFMYHLNSSVYQCFGLNSRAACGKFSVLQGAAVRTLFSSDEHFQDSCASLIMATNSYEFGEYVRSLSWWQLLKIQLEGAKGFRFEWRPHVHDLFLFDTLGLSVAFFVVLLVIVEESFKQMLRWVFGSWSDWVFGIGEFLAHLSYSNFVPRLPALFMHCTLQPLTFWRRVLFHAMFNILVTQLGKVVSYKSSHFTAFLVTRFGVGFGNLILAALACFIALMTLRTCEYLARAAMLARSNRERQAAVLCSALLAVWRADAAMAVLGPVLWSLFAAWSFNSRPRTVIAREMALDGVMVEAGILLRHNGGFTYKRVDEVQIGVHQFQSPESDPFLISGELLPMIDVSTTTLKIPSNLLHDVEADGHCFYRALALALKGDQGEYRNYGVANDEIGMATTEDVQLTSSKLLSSGIAVYVNGRAVCRSTAVTRCNKHVQLILVQGHYQLLLNRRNDGRGAWQTLSATQITADLDRLKSDAANEQDQEFKEFLERVHAAASMKAKPCEFEIQVVKGVPGCGKTRTIKRDYEKACQVTAFAAVAKADDMKTYHSALRDAQDFDTLVLDEYHAIPTYLARLLVACSGARHVRALGDVVQIKAIDFEAGGGTLAFDPSFYDRAVTSNMWITYRFSESVCALIRPFYGPELASGATHETVVTFGGPVTGHHIVCTSARAALFKCKCGQPGCDPNGLSTAHRSEGMTFDHVTADLSDVLKVPTQEAMIDGVKKNIRAHAIVAITRARKSLNIILPDGYPQNIAGFQQLMDCKVELPTTDAGKVHYTREDRSIKDFVLGCEVPKANVPYDEGARSGLIHNGRAKLTVHDFYFVSQFSRPRDTVIVVGAAPGYHYGALAKEFPDREFVLYDPRPIHAVPAGRSLPKNIKIVQSHVTDKELSNYAKKKCVLISDIMTETSDQGLLRDNCTQNEFVKACSPRAYSIKLNLPYADSGDYAVPKCATLLYVPWSKPNHCELRAIGSPVYVNKQVQTELRPIKVFHQIARHMYQNKRQTGYSDAQNVKADMSCTCFDCTCTWHMLHAVCRSDNKSMKFLLSLVPLLEGGGYLARKETAVRDRRVCAVVERNDITVPIPESSTLEYCVPTADMACEGKAALGDPDPTPGDDIPPANIEAIQNMMIAAHGDNLLVGRDMQTLKTDDLLPGSMIDPYDAVQRPKPTKGFALAPIPTGWLVQRACDAGYAVDTMIDRGSHYNRDRLSSGDPCYQAKCAAEAAKSVEGLITDFNLKPITADVYNVGLAHAKFIFNQMVKPLKDELDAVDTDFLNELLAAAIATVGKRMRWDLECDPNKIFTVVKTQVKPIMADEDREHLLTYARELLGGKKSKPGQMVALVDLFVIMLGVIVNKLAFSALRAQLAVADSPVFFGNEPGKSDKESFVDYLGVPEGSNPHFGKMLVKGDDVTVRTAGEDMNIDVTTLDASHNEESRCAKQYMSAYFLQGDIHSHSGLYDYQEMQTKHGRRWVQRLTSHLTRIVQLNVQKSGDGDTLEMANSFTTFREVYQMLKTGRDPIGFKLKITRGKPEWCHLALLERRGDAEVVYDVYRYATKLLAKPCYNAEDLDEHARALKRDAQCKLRDWRKVLGAVVYSAHLHNLPISVVHAAVAGVVWVAENDVQAIKSKFHTFSYRWSVFDAPPQ